jgi:hypothetical protein
LLQSVEIGDVVIAEVQAHDSLGITATLVSYVSPWNREIWDLNLEVSIASY